MDPSTRGDSGATLIEVLVAVVIMGITVVAVLGGLLTSITVSDVHRKQATAGASAENYAEQLDRHVAGTGYVPCAAPSDYAPATVGFTAPAGYTAGVASIRYWPATGTAWTTGCLSGADQGLQEVTVQVASSDGRATERSVIVVRKPCGQGSTC